MKQPDTLIAKYLFLGLVGFLIFFIFSVLMWYLNLSGQCSSPDSNDQDQGKKNNNTIIHLLIFVLVCSMAAQAVNQSYTRIVPQSAINAAAKTLKST
jgi:hypothetical protein